MSKLRIKVSGRILDERHRDLLRHPILPCHHRATTDRHELSWLGALTRADAGIPRPRQTG